MLLVDVGNTRIKWGCAQDQVISDYGALEYKDRPITEVLATAWAQLPSPERILVVNVAGSPLTQGINRYCHEHFRREPDYVQTTPHACGVTNGYIHPTQLGADRWAAVIGAYHLYSGPACIISCGTAITVDTVTREGRHLGGLIAPGIGVMQRALASVAPAIPKEPGDTVTLYARDTLTAITSGSLYAAAGLLERATTEIQAQQGALTKFLLTGGDAERMQSIIRVQFTLAPHLVLEGLAVLAGKQT
ncbi:MAG TPA: type III pantothenate kinase [Gammaproteobacteria bacterium]|nr:type III pantothenate kinase [Gammaproteobacteria bacterium]HVC28249.1 type III pantothenate kinase [Gammaproteobacteria bacterium]